SPSSPPDVQVHAMWLRDPSEPSIPDTVATLRLLVYVPGEKSPRETIRRKSKLVDTDDGRPEFVRDGLPIDVPLTLAVEARDLAGIVQYFGQVGSLVLKEGERRVVPLRMYEVGMSVRLEEGDSLSPRFLHTATPLADGRVLIAGGF